jgi:T-complex protein 1 subunit delta
MPPRAAAAKPGGQKRFNDKSKPAEMRQSNIIAGKSIADTVRTSLGPKGMDKMIQTADGNVTITNDGATILKLLDVMHPAAKMLVDLSQAQDVEAGDGTTSVVVLCGSLLTACEKLLKKGLHPTVISEAFGAACRKSVEILEGISVPIELSDREQLIKCASTSLNSKVVSQYSGTIAPMVVDAVLKVQHDGNCDLRDIKIIKKLEGTIEDTELIDGVVFDRKVSHMVQGGTDRVTSAKIALVQFCLSPPKTDLDNQVIVSDYAQMDRVLKEERQYILGICKKIKKSGCNVLLIQKSILREAVNDLALHFLAKMKILVVRDVEREDVEFLCKSLGCKPIANPDSFTADKLGIADTVEEISIGSSRVVKVTGAKVEDARTCSILVRGSNKLVLEEADRSIHDALCVVRCLVKKRALIAGGGAPETEIALALMEHAHSLTGPEAYCFRAFAEAFEVIPFTLAENAGLNPIETVTLLRAKHQAGQKTAGINVRKGTITDILEENVLQPLLVSTSSITLATETVRSILKIDDIVNTR